LAKKIPGLQSSVQPLSILGIDSKLGLCKKVRHGVQSNSDSFNYTATEK